MKYILLFFLFLTLPSFGQAIDLETVKKEHTLQDYTKLGEGIVIFDKNECSRCERTIAYCIENNLDFKLLNISGSEDNAILMWQLLEQMGYEEETVQTPVIIVNGKVTYNHEDLDLFLEALPKS